MPSKTYRLQLSSTYKESEKVPDFITSIQNKSGLSEKNTYTLMLTLSEAVTNAIVHGNREDPAKNVDIAISVYPDKIIAEITDEGDGFTPDRSHNPLDKEKLLDQSGRGLFLIEELCNRVEYLKNGTKLRLTYLR